MKKNKTMRAASALLVAALLSTSIISGTFAKYTSSAGAQDSARVAKWGVTVTATGNEAFEKSYKGTAPNGNVDTVFSKTSEKVVAPGTSGTLLTYEITGTPEVQTKVEATATLTLKDWTIDADATYCPLVFKVTRGNSTTTYKLGTTENTEGNDKVYTTTDALSAAVVKAITDMSKPTVNTNTSLQDSITVTWEWPFNDTDVSGAYQTNIKDTALGDKAAQSTAPTISMTSSVTVTQID